MEELVKQFGINGVFIAALAYLGKWILDKLVQIIQDVTGALANSTLHTKERNELDERLLSELAAIKQKLETLKTGQ